MVQLSRQLLWISCLLFVATSCSQNATTPTPPNRSQPVVAHTSHPNAPGTATGSKPILDAPNIDRGRLIFGTTCIACHGPGGDGSGAAAVSLTPKPRNLTDANWQRSVTDTYLQDIIVGGGAAVEKSPLMPPNPALETRPRALRDLIAFIRSLARK